MKMFSKSLHIFLKSIFYDHERFVMLMSLSVCKEKGEKLIIFVTSAKQPAVNCEPVKLLNNQIVEIKEELADFPRQKETTALTIITFPYHLVPEYPRAIEWQRKIFQSEPLKIWDWGEQSAMEVISNQHDSNTFHASRSCLSAYIACVPTVPPEQSKVFFYCSME